MELLKHLQKGGSVRLLRTIVLLWSSSCLVGVAGQTTCADMPCQSGATCTDLSDRYNCTCPPGYTGINCDADVDECEERPCLNNGICFDGFNTFTCLCAFGFTGSTCELRDACILDQPCPANSTCVNGTTGNHTCLCPPDYTGEYCSMRINNCASMPCMNGGTCTDGINAFNCSCQAGFEGERCQTDIDMCEESMCLNGGTCIDGTGDAYYCECPPGFTSPNCSVALGICELLVPCQNNATCTDISDSDYYCICLPGFALKNCTATTNNCMNSSCLNEGICIDQPCPEGTNCINSDAQNFSCICPDSFTGTDCSIDLTSCPCQNNGTCVDGVIPYNCSCVDGYTGTDCETNIDECSPNPCQNGGTCTDGINSYTCSCVDGYTGTDCETNIDECSPNPCQNGGTCMDGINSYTCSCVDGYTGTDCETNIDECSPNPCQNGGTCMDGINSYTCSCVDGYTGTDCETNIDECSPNPCQNGGTCTDGINSYNCSCVDGYTGTDCETNIDECSPNPCQNGGTCTDGINSYTCSCVDGYTGTDCETNIDECSPNPCQNGGTCMDEINSYTCSCVDGYTGTDCETNIDECSPNPCQNGGTCTDGINSYNCSCVDGYTGTDCETNIDECSPNPCQNGGTCTDGINSYTCSCVDGYTGTDCETNICSPNPCQNGGICSLGVNNSVQCNCQLGWTGPLCEIEIDIEVAAFTGNSYLQYTSLNQRNSTITVVNLAFRTAQPDGQLLYNGQDDVTGEGDFIQLRVTGGLLQLRVDLGSFITDVVSTERVDNDEWHFVEIRVDDTIATFTLDNTTTYTENILGTFASLEVFGSLYLGGVARNIIVSPEAKNTPAFIGCISQFEEDERNSSELVPIGGLNIVNCNVSACQDIVCENGGSCVFDPSSQLEPACSCAEGFGGETCGTVLCSPDPCLHGSTCVPVGETGYRCICQLGYSGMNCETALDISVPQFFNTSYIRYITDPSITLRSTFIEINIKPAQNFSTGILLYASQSSNIDYFLLALNASRVLFQFNCGSGPGSVQSVDQLPAGVWHNIQVHRSDNMANLIVNSAPPVTGFSRGSFSSINLNNYLHVGGLPSGHILPFSVTITTGFDGCIITNFTIAGGVSRRNAVIERDSSAMVAECGVPPCLVNPCLNGGICNSTGSSISCICPPSYLPPICNNSLPDPCLSNNTCSNGSTCVASPDGSIRCICPFQRMGPFCNSPEPITVPSFSKTDYAHFSFSTPVGVFVTSTITFSFLAYASEGLLLYSAYHMSATTADFISLAMKDGFLEFRYNLGSGMVLITSPTRLALRRWYEVYASRTTRTGNLTINGVGTTIGISPGSFSHLDLTTSLYVGGAPDYRMLVNDVGVSTGFVGCLHNLAINGALYNWASHLTSHDVEQCNVPPPISPCLEQLGMECQNGGTCVRSSVMRFEVPTYECQCTSDFTGVFCETLLTSFTCTVISCQNGGECLLNDQGQGTVCSCPIPYAGANCTDQITIDEAAMFNGQSYIEINRNSITPSLPAMNSFSLEFRTNDSNTLIFWQGLEINGNDFISLGVVAGRLELRFDLGIGAVMVSSNTMVSDGVWHTVSVIRNNGTAFLTLDNENPRDVTSHYTSLDTTSNYWIGGHRNIAATSYESGLVGCLRQLIINNEAIDLDDLSIIASSSNVVNCGSS